jgi:hypothetical protein
MCCVHGVPHLNILEKTFWLHKCSKTIVVLQHNTISFILFDHKKAEKFFPKGIEKRKKDKEEKILTYMKHEEHGSCRRKFQLSMFQQILKLVVNN